MAKRRIDGSLCEEKVFKVTSGDAVNYSFEWRVKNFLAVQSSSDLIKEQEFSFEAGDSNGCPTKWGCRLKEEPSSKSVGIYFKMENAPPNLTVIGSFDFQTIKPNGGICKWTRGVTTVFIPGQSLGFKDMIPVDEKALNELIWKDGSIFVKVKLKLFLSRPTVQPNELDVQEEVNSFEKRELQKLSNVMTQMIEVGSQPGTVKIIKVVSKDRVEFYANTTTLSARSPVFDAMFESGNWMEGQDSNGGEGGGGSLVLEDLSGKTVKVLLHYLMGGVLLKDDWKAEDVILELTYAAHKYQLEGLTEFLDKVLPAIPYGTEILTKLTLLTKRLGMKNAEKELFAKLKESATDIDQLVLDKEGSLLGHN